MRTGLEEESGEGEYLQLAEELLDGDLAHRVDLGAVDGDAGVGEAVRPAAFLQRHQALACLQQHAQDHIPGLHVSLQTHTHTQVTDWCVSG